MENKQTAVEWLVENLPYPLPLNIKGLKKIQQAKQIEKEQIMDAYHEGCQWGYERQPYNPEQYYNETYGNKNKNE